MYVFLNLDSEAGARGHVLVSSGLIPPLWLPSVQPKHHKLLALKGQKGLVLGMRGLAFPGAAYKYRILHYIN